MSAGPYTQLMDSQNEWTWRAEWLGRKVLELVSFVFSFGRPCASAFTSASIYVLLMLNSG